MMSTGFLVVAILAVVGIAALIAMRRRKASDDDGRYLIQRPGIAGLHCHPSIPRATAEGMADLLWRVYQEAWPIVRDAYAAACHERGLQLPLGLPRWHTARLEPGQMSDGRWTAYGVSSGVWALAVGCSPLLIAEEIHSVMRSYLHVYGSDKLPGPAEFIHRWISEVYGV